MRRILWLVAGLAASVVAAQTPLGDLFPIAELTAGRQSRPDLASQPGGSFVVVWDSEEGDGDSLAVRGRRFSSSGVPLSGEFGVNEATTGSQWAPQVAADALGNFVVVWTGPDGDDNAVLARLFDADGKPLGPEFQVNEQTPVDSPWPDVGRNAAGEFLVVWRDRATGNVSASVRDSAGAVVVPETLVNASGSHPAGGNHPPRAAGGIRSDGAFVVAWQGEHEVDGLPTTDIFQQRFAPDGTPLGGELQISDSGPNGWYFSAGPSIGVDRDDGFLVVWHTQLNLAWGGDFGRRTNAAGSSGPIKQFALETFGHSFSMVPSGEFVVVWSEYYCCYGGGRFDPPGDLVAQFEIPDAGGWPAAQTHLGARSTDFVLVRVDGDATETELFGQRFADVVFTDGFESGDTSAWSSTLP